MTTSGPKLNGGFKTALLVLALLAYGISIGVYKERLDSIDSTLQKIEKNQTQRMDRIEAKMDRHIEIDDV